MDKIINRRNERFPQKIEIRPSAKCNLKCIYCEPRKIFLERPEYIQKNNLLKLVDKEVYFRILKEGKKLGVSEIHICGGGEPFIRDDLLDIMTAIKKEGLKGCIVTNGTLLDKDKIKRLIEIEFDSINFSIDGPDKRLNDFLRGGKKAFRTVVKNIKLISKKRNNKPFITLGPVLSKYNQYKIKSFLKLGQKLKIDKLIFQPVTLPHKIQEESKVSKTNKFKEQLKKSIKLSKQISLKTNLEEIYDFYFNNQKESCRNILICSEPFDQLTIQPNGNADPCPIILKNPHKEDKKVNIKYKNLKDIWNSQYFREFREKLLKNKIPNKKFCSLCCGMIELKRMKM